MALIVQKYGGTSVGSPDRIKNVARRVAKFKAQGHDIVVVPSAMSGETNRLIGLAKEISAAPNPRELDVIASTGEQVSVGLLAIALQAEGLDAVSYAGWQVPVKTDSSFTKARITSIDDAVAAAVSSPAPRPVDQLADPHHLADSDPLWAGGDALRLRQMAGAVSPAGARTALGLIDAVPGPVAGVLRTGLDMLLAVAKAVP